MRSFEGLPINIGFLGKGNCSGRAPLDEQLAAGAAGLKIHEDWGATPSVIRAALSAADDFDVQVSIHTDTLNESGLRRGHDRRVRGPHDPHVPHRGRRRRARAGHHEGRRRAQRAAELDQPDPAVRDQLAGRAVRHDHGLPQPQPEDPVGRVVRREPGPGRDDRGRERPARHGRDLDDLQRLAGDGPHRRELAARDPDRRRDEGGPRRACRRTPRATTTSGCCGTSPR